MTRKDQLYGFKIHPFADVLPMMPEEEFEELKNSIREDGVKVPVVVDMNSKQILDGRNRLKAAIEIGLKKSDIPFDHFHGTSEEAATLVSILNIDRRHLDQSQRAMAAAGLSMCLGLSQPKTAKKLNTSARSTSRASKVIQHGSALLIDKVKGGKISVGKAAKLTELPKREQNEILRSPELPKDNKSPDWKLTKQKMLATANATMRLIDELQSKKPCKNNLNIAMLKAIKQVISKGTEWK